MDTGPGPEGSSLTMDCRCSMGSGVEKESGFLIGVVSVDPGDLALDLHSIIFYTEIYSEQGYCSTYDRKIRWDFT